MDTCKNTITSMSECRNPQVNHQLLKTFQSGDVDTSNCITPAKMQTAILMHQLYFFELRMLKRFLDKVFKGDNERFSVRNNTINDFRHANSDVSRKKNRWVTLIFKAGEAKLESDDPFKIWCFK